MSDIVVDRLGIPIQVGHQVMVYQKEETTKAVVHELFPDRPTKEGDIPGHWVDIAKTDDLLEGMMSYILEVITDVELIDVSQIDILSSKVRDVGTRCCVAHPNQDESDIDYPEDTE